MIRDREAHPDATTRTWLGWLVGARLLLAGLSLALAVIVEKLDGDQGNPAIWGVYWTIVAAFTATIAAAMMSSRTRNPNRFATIQVGIDVAIVTSLVYFSGAGESVFVFLYAIVVLYGALILDRKGVMLSAGLASFGYGFVLFGSELGLLPAASAGGRHQALMVLGAYWAFYTGALVVLGMLANTLSSELRRTGAALDRRTHDLRRLRDLHLRTVESIGSGLLTMDETGCITSFNPEAERISGIDTNQAEGKHLEEIFPGASAVLQEEIHREPGEARTGRQRLAFRTRNGDELFLGLAASNLRGEEGERIGQVVIFQDVTQVVSMEHELRQSERLAAVGEMAARIAHEIRNPLAAISGSVQVLQNSGARSQDDLGHEPEHEKLMNIVVREVDRLNVLIGDFLRYSRPAPLRTEPVFLAGLVEEVAKMNEAQPPAGIEIDLDLDATIEICADRAQLSAVLWNLWNNALEAITGPGRISVALKRVEREPAQGESAADRNGGSTGRGQDATGDWAALLEIRDTGAGISPEDREMIFEPFYTTKPEGTGLGLATVQRIIEQHGGSIGVSTEEGEGTCFRILLPGQGELR